MCSTKMFQSEKQQRAVSKAWSLNQQDMLELTCVVGIAVGVAAFFGAALTVLVLARLVATES